MSRENGLPVCISRAINQSSRKSPKLKFNMLAKRTSKGATVVTVVTRKGEDLLTSPGRLVLGTGIGRSLNMLVPFSRTGGRTGVKHESDVRIAKSTRSSSANRRKLMSRSACQVDVIRCAALVFQSFTSVQSESSRSEGCKGWSEL